MSHVTKVPEQVTSYKEDSEVSKIFGSLTPFAEPNWYHGYASPYYKGSHRNLRIAVRKFMDEKVMDFAAEWDEAKSTPPHIYKEMGAAGYILASLYPLPPKSSLGEIDVSLPGDVPYEEWDAFHDFIFNDEISRVGSIGFAMGTFSGMSESFPIDCCRRIDIRQETRLGSLLSLTSHQQNFRKR